MLERDIIWKTLNQFNPELLEQKIGFFSYVVLHQLFEQNKKEEGIFLKVNDFIKLGIPYFDVAIALTSLEQDHLISLEKGEKDDIEPEDQIKITSDGIKSVRSIEDKVKEIKEKKKNEICNILETMGEVTSDFNFDKFWEDITCHYAELEFLNLQERVSRNLLPDSIQAAPDEDKASPLTKKVIEYIKKEANNQGKYRELHDELFHLSFMKYVFNRFVFVDKKTSILTHIDEIDIILDTNVFLASLIDRDCWYGTTHALLSTVVDINSNGKNTSKSNVKINLYISERSLKEFFYVLRSAERDINQIIFTKGKGRDLEDKMSKSPVVDFFSGMWGSFHDYESNLIAKLQRVIKDYEIKKLKYIDIIKSKGYKEYMTKEYIPELKSFHSKSIEHDVYLLFHNKLLTETKDKKGTRNSWIWTYHGFLPEIEARIFETNRYTLHGLYMAVFLETIALLCAVPSLVDKFPILSLMDKIYTFKWLEKNKEFSIKKLEEYLSFFSDQEIKIKDLADVTDNIQKVSKKYKTMTPSILRQNRLSILKQQTETRR